MISCTNMHEPLIQKRRRRRIFALISAIVLVVAFRSVFIDGIHGAIMVFAVILAMVSFFAVILFLAASNGVTRKLKLVDSLSKLPDDYRLLDYGHSFSDSKVPSQYIVIGPNGLFLIEETFFHGQIESGSDDDDYLTAVSTDEGEQLTQKIPNPAKVLTKHIASIKETLASIDLKPDVLGIVYLPWHPPLYASKLIKMFSLKQGREKMNAYITGHQPTSRPLDERDIEKIISKLDD
jgi:hypothetical protein